MTINANPGADKQTPAPGASSTRGFLRGWLRRIKHNAWARRIVFALVQRFPRLHAPLRRLSEGAVIPVRAVSASALAPDWPGPLPPEFVTMSEPARQVLLDLARAGQPPSTH